MACTLDGVQTSNSVKLGLAQKFAHGTVVSKRPSKTKTALDSTAITRLQ